jgi:hypothetical protein
VYRLRISSSGLVHFQSREHGNEGITATDSVSPDAFLWLLTEAERTGILRLPARIEAGQDLCRVHATDQPVVVVSIHGADGVIQVVHYTGCVETDGREHWRPPQLEAAMTFYSAVDSVAGADRWIPIRSFWDALDRPH